MPRIDPVQLLKCLSVLLSPDGGIRSINEVKRLVGLMNKFSKKLVSKCIYIQILKCTQPELLGLFMGEGGWSLTHLWLTDSIRTENWALIREILKLLLLCPVDVERLKTNNCPKLVKELTKVTSQPDVQHLSSKVVEQWLRLVKGETVTPVASTETNMHLSDVESIEFVDCEQIPDEGIATIETCVADSEENGSTDEEQINADIIDTSENSEVKCNEAEEKGVIPVLKISVKDGKQVVSKVEDKNDKKNTSSETKLSDTEEKSNTSIKEKENDRSKRKESDKPKSISSSSSTSRSRSSKSSSSSKHSSKSTSSDRHRSEHSSSRSSSKSSRSKSRESSTSSRSSKDNDKHKKHSDGKSKSEKERGKESLDKSKQQAEKNIETLNKLQNPSVMKLGKIPKKSNSASNEKSEEKKDKPSISIEVRNPNDPNRPKTVKMFNSKFRSHGLDEEAKPPLIRGSVKKSTATPPVTPPSVKRQSPIRSTDSPPEKRPKVIEHIEKPGAIKLIPPKPKPAFLLESDLFMDALTASATNKKEPRKRKRRFSGSKETLSNDTSPPVTPTAETSPTSDRPSEEKKPTPLRFYQDTLDTEEDDKVKSPVIKIESSSETVKTEIKPELKSEIKSDITESVEMQSPLLSPTIYKTDEDYKKVQLLEPKPEEAKTENLEPKTLKGVLCVHKKSGPKKSLRWRDSELEEIKYFELDETERTNVTKPFLDMTHMERVHERESFQKARNLPNDDVMEEKMSWRGLIPMEIIPIDHGKHSKEKDIQKAREKIVSQCLYFNKLSIPDSAFEPDFENHPTTDPVIIPLEDVTGNPDSVNDFQNTPWPEPKSAPVQMNSGMPVAPLFQPLPPFGPGFNNPPFGMPGFQSGPMVMPTDWHMNGQNMMMPDNMNMNHDMFMGPGPVPGPNPMFPGAMGGDFQMMDTMNGPIYPPGFPGQMGHPGQGSNRPIGPPGTGGPTGPIFGPHSNRGGNIRGPGPRTNNPNWRNKGPNNNWNGPPRGGNSNRGNSRVCCYFQRSGYCRLGDKCQYLHVGANNGPF